MTEQTVEVKKFYTANFHGHVTLTQESMVLWDDVEAMVVENVPLLISAKLLEVLGVRFADMAVEEFNKKFYYFNEAVMEDAERFINRPSNNTLKQNMAKNKALALLELLMDIATA